jgi:excisionase family DNA binding protein
MDEKPGDVLTIKELAAYLKISKSTLYKLVREGKIPSQKIGRHWRFRKGAIDLWLEETPATVSPGEKQVARSAGTARIPEKERDSKSNPGEDQ